MAFAGLFATPMQANSSAFTCTTFSYLDAGWSVTTTGINNQKQIVGYATDMQRRVHGFVRNADGTFVAIDDPATAGIAGAYPRAINNAGQVAGNYYLPDGPHGFLREANGTISEIAPPPLPPPGPDSEPVLNMFEVAGINDSGVVSGVFNLAYKSGSYIYPDKWNYVFSRDSAGTYTILDARYNTIDNQGPLAARINNAGYVLEIGGINWDAYLRSPDGSSTALLFPGIPSYSHLGRQYLYANTVAFNNGVIPEDITSAGTFLPVNSGFIRAGNGNIQAVVCPQDVQAKVAVTGINGLRAVSGNISSDSAPVQQGVLAEPTFAAAALQISNDWWDFGTSAVGEPSCHPARIYLTNPTNADLNIQVIYFGNTVESAPGQVNAGPYAITETNCAVPTGNPLFPYAKRTLRSGDWCYINFNYTPTVGGSQPGQLIMLDDTRQSPHTVQLSGSGVSAKLQYSNTSWDFGVQPIGRTTGEGIIYIYNPSPAPVTFRSISATGGSSSPIPEFIAYEGTCNTLAPYTTCNIRFVFTPSAAGERYGAIRLVSNADPTEMVIPLQGYAQ